MWMRIYFIGKTNLNMKKSLILLLAFVSSLCMGQFNIDLGFQKDKPIQITDLLEEISWLKIIALADTSSEHRTKILQNEDITEYQYEGPGLNGITGHFSSFQIVSYQGQVLEYSSDLRFSERANKSNYFDKIVFLKYVRGKYPNIPDSFHLGTKEQSNIFRAYYTLLGVDAQNEYGWICEYSTVRLPTKQRIATIPLIKFQRKDILLKLINYPNLQTQLYAIDALIYKNQLLDKWKDENLEAIKSKKSQIAELKSTQSFEQLKYENYELESLIEYNAQIDTMKLTPDVLNKIAEIKNSSQMVVTCGNSGSYKLYETPIAEILSDEEIKNTYSRYEELRKLGYWE